MTRSNPQRLLVAGGVSLCLATVSGAGALALAEGSDLLDGLWLSFSIVSTTGFGTGPRTHLGQLMGMIVFVWAALSYLLLLIGASALGQLLADERRRLHVVSQRDVRQLARDLHRN